MEKDFLDLNQGANWIEEKDGTFFAIFSANATKIEIVLYSRENQRYPKESIEIKDKKGNIWFTFISGIKPGDLYCYKVHGPYKPEEGFRFNPNKVLIDPYAKAVAGTIPLKWDDSLFDFKIINNEFLMNDLPNDEFIPKCVVINPYFKWEDYDFIKNRKRWKKEIIYETHVKGFTQLMKDLPNEIRGKYAALSSKNVISYLKDLGITAIELMPVHAFIDDKILVEKGLRNYWGYNPINYFSPEARYSSSGYYGEQVYEFKKMVNELHKEGIAVILDVVYNHTGEGNHLGPFLSFKGIDNKSYYLLNPNDQRYYIDYTGVGNTLNTSSNAVIQMIIDSLRYWVKEMHVDGFRFDLAPVLARNYEVVNMEHPIIKAIEKDPALENIKLIAEPWDLGPNGYQLGKFPSSWYEWNGKYRDLMRRFWRGESFPYYEIANLILGSPDLFVHKNPFASINYITCHDGFTLEDLVSYNQKHNEANCFDNKDGSDENYSFNFGIEGPTNDEEILRQREKQKRNFIITLMISQGTPMILGGDELSRTQKGNNNAFCQDNEISWYSWELDERKKKFFNFMKSIINFRKSSRIFENPNFLKDVIWLKENGSVVDEFSWRMPTNFIAFIFKDENKFLVILNAGSNRKFRLPEGKWQVLFSSTEKIKEGEEIEIEERSSVIFEKVND